MKKEDYIKLIAKYGLNNPILVEKKNDKHCVFVYNEKTKRLNAVNFNKFGIINNKKRLPLNIIKLKEKKHRLQKGRGKKR